MRFKSIKRWKICPETVGLLFFAQRLDELLWDYTLDSYKPVTLNAPTLCKEALTLIRDIENKLIDENNLKHVLEELAWSIKNDPTAKSLLDQPIEKYLPPPTTDQINLVDLKRKLEILEKTLTPYRYLHRCFDTLMRSVQNAEKKSIDSTLRNTITTLLNIGISKKYLYETTQEFFFAPSGPEITGHQNLEDFLKLVYPHSHSFKVYFLASNLINEVKDSISSFSMELTETLPNEVAAVARKYNLTKKDGYSYLVINDLHGFDVYSIQSKATSRLEQLSDLFTLFHHREKITWHPQVIISQCCLDFPVCVTASKGAMDKPYDMPANKASKDLNLLIRSIGLNGASFNRFNRVADLHGLCVATDVVENQLVSLWTSLETLIPHRTNQAKIASVIDAMMPFLLSTYIKRLVSRLAHDLVTWRRWTIKQILNKVETEGKSSITEKLIALLCVPSNEELRKELYKELGDFQLLRFRADSLSKLLCDPKKIIKALDSHEQKVRWQIRRIYRTRNLIVHAASKPSYIHGLVENGHDYLDLILFEVMKFACGDYRANTLEQAFDLAAIKYEKFRKTLESTTAFDASNCQFLSDHKNVLTDYKRQAWRTSPNIDNLVSLATDHG